jgi:hypothetical protein
MGRIIFVNPFAKTLITGGIKSTYYHAELLSELGFRTTVFQPDGPPAWCSPRLQALATNTLMPTAEDILVFPETLNGWLGRAARTPTPARKIIFCQNQFYMISYATTAEAYAKMGFSHFIVPGHVCKNTIEDILQLQNISIVPYYIDQYLFHPREKITRIVTVPRKWAAHDGFPSHADMVRTMLGMKYPHLRSVPWELLEKKSESEVAEIMGGSTVFLSLCYMEACPLAPLEAMASGCVVVGYHGNGGLEYATPENGIWHSPEHLERVTDSIADVLHRLERGDPEVLKMRDAGMATAADFTRDRTKTALNEVYGALLAQPVLPA